MNAKTILAAVITLMLSANIYATEPVVLKNETATEFGKQVEQTSIAEGTNTLDKRMISKFDHDGKLFERVIYKWDTFDGWQPVKKMEYSYTTNNVLAQVANTEWDKAKKDWSKKTQVSRYDINKEGDMYVAEVIKK